jgi:hypothetical protein
MATSSSGKAPRASSPNATHATVGSSKKASQKGRARRSRPVAEPAAASTLIDRRIAELRAGDASWRGDTLAHIRATILAADSAIFEEWKWENPVWSHPGAGIICTGETYKKAVKLTFAKGARVADPRGLFNASLEGSTRRAIDIREGESLHAAALKSLVKAAIKL